MNILVFGGTRFMGKHLIHELLAQGHDVTMATRGNVEDCFGDCVTRVIVDRLCESDIKKIYAATNFDVVYDSLAYCSNDVKILLENFYCHKYVSISTTAVYEKHFNTVEEDFNPLNKELFWCNRVSVKTRGD